MHGRIAIIGWGSLIWDPEILGPWITGDWRMGGGPALPLEFSRISPKRLMGLAVCIDEDVGAPCTTHAIASVRGDVDLARADLAARERAPLDLIGVVCARSGRATGAGAAHVAAWVAATGAAGAVWTGLRPNFRDHAGHDFDLAAAEAWLRCLTGASRDEAVRYLQSAPGATDTPLRRLLASREWWGAEAARVAALDASVGRGA
jgi:hypothetical protein